MRLLSVLFLSVAIFGICDGSKILGIFPMPSKSHYILGEALLRGLAAKGHQVTMISPYTLDKPMKNYKDVVIDGMVELKDANAHRFTSLNTTILEKANLMFELFPAIYHTAHNSTNVREFVKKGEKYDLCVVSFMMMESMFGLCNAVQATPVGFSIVGMTSFLSYHTNNPVPFSYVPPFLSITDQMTFMERVKNVLTSYFFEGLTHFVLMPYHQRLLSTYYPEAPKIEELMDNVDLYLMNSHTSTDSPKPVLPNIIPIGGYHLQIMDEIPKNIKKVLDESKRGVIYFNMGSNAKSADLDPEIRNAILNTFSKVDYDVVWKFEADLPNKPKNVHIAKWLPQRPILMHPNVKMFMTHGGLGGTVEAIYGGVPMICMPMFGDQGKNCAESAKNQYAIVVELLGLTEDKLKNAIKEIANNPVYKEQIKLKSDLYRNQEINPMDKAVYWVEHVIRHKGAKHLKSNATNIPWYQYYLLDVSSFLAGIALLILAIVYFIIKLNLRVLCWIIRKITGKGKCAKIDKKQKIKKQ
ncbi:LOW QUALITY PROTEIN: UDP-glycosyltransferase UGT5-like [Atheta coriaria]|uniref:LOW QUALITY PROTEIN: UDP-glycosyltransferase UGT5-like n=1 Tax=Dalotia coriaria TaxID=877792 RepID=UPI0031F402D1